MDMKFTAIIEQTDKYRKRIKYITETDSFVETEYDSLLYSRDFHYPYGWIKESGTPPQPHLDVIIMTDKDFKLGEEVEVNIIGVFMRDDNDCKLVAVLSDRSIDDISMLTDAEKQDLLRLYSPRTENEGWFGKEKAEMVINKFFDNTLR